MDSPADGIVYVALQELATRVAHYNTGKRLDDRAGHEVMKRVASDENRHYLFYRDLASAAIELDPSEMVLAIERQVRTFEMPGTGHRRLRSPTPRPSPGPASTTSRSTTTRFSSRSCSTTGRSSRWKASPPRPSRRAPQCSSASSASAGPGAASPAVARRPRRRWSAPARPSLSAARHQIFWVRTVGDRAGLSTQNVLEGLGSGALGQGDQLVERGGQTVGHRVQVGHRLRAGDGREVHPVEVAPHGDVEADALEDRPDRVDGEQARAGRRRTACAGPARSTRRGSSAVDGGRPAGTASTAAGRTRTGGAACTRPSPPSSRRRAGSARPWPTS